MFRNSYKGTCVVCGASVLPGAGFVERSDKFQGAATKTLAGKNWGTLCASQYCHDAGLGDPTGTTRERKLLADGTITCQITREELPVVKAIPGARWSPKTKLWSVSTDSIHREDVLARAKQLGLQVAEELTAVAPDPQIEALLVRPQLEGLRPYQFDGARWMAKRSHCLCAMDMGLGKTRTSLSAIDWTLPLLIVCPATLKGNWQDEIEKWNLPYKVTILKGRASFRWPEPGEAVIVNYDILPDTVKAPEHPPVVIVDEAQALKSHKAARTKKFRALRKHACKVIGLTGTPLDKSPMELKGVLESIGCFPWSFTGFRKAFNAYDRQVAHGKTVVDFRRDEKGAIVVEPGTLEKLETVMLRRTKEQVAKDLPPVQIIEIPCPIDDAASAAFDEIGSEWGDLLLSDELPPIQVFASVRKALATSRIPAMLERVAQYEDTETPLLVFSAHRGPIEALEGREGWGVIHGGVSPEQRSQVVRDFQAGKLRGVGLTIQAGGVGITLTHASHALFVDQDWSPSMNAQARARLHRIGQTASSVTIELMTSDHAIDRHVGRLLWGKEELVRRTLDARYEYEYQGLQSEPREAWEARVSSTEDKRRAAVEAEDRRRLAKLAERGQLSPEQADERARLRGVQPFDLGLAPVAAIQQAWAYLLSVCDGAQERDDSGFDQSDVLLARWLSTAVAHAQPHALALAWSKLRKYHRQVSESWPELFVENAPDCWYTC